MNLWAYQEELVPRLIKGHMLMWWDAGSGKTLPLLTAAKQIGGRTLYLGPPVIRTQVAREAQDFGLYAKRDIQIVASSKEKISPKAKLVICSYDHSIYPAIWKQLFALEWDALVLDEAHLLKETTAKRTRAVYGATRNSKGALFKRAKLVWTATGTPLLNDPSDLWTHVSRLFPQVLEQAEIRDKNGWIMQFCHVKQTPYGPKILGAKNLEQLKTLLKPHVSRVKKSGLPPLSLTAIWVPPQELDLSDVPEEAMIELHRILKTEGGKLEQLAVPLASLRRRIGLAKAAHCIELVMSESLGGIGKTIVFYQHKSVAEEMMRLLAMSRFRAKFVHYSGGLTQKKRDEVVHSFQKDPNVRLLLAQIQAAGVGLNLQAADRVIILEPAWTPAVNEQAIARAWRKGQQKNVWASFVMLESSVDELVSSRLMQKARIIEKVLG
jgi:SNF2 family DNA or RNA helicase